jgi:hypothetical protein
VFTRLFGQADLAVYNAVFFPLLVLRVVVVAAISAAGAGSLRLPSTLALSLGVLLSVPALYTGWSVGRYFGLTRAAGGDHFRRRFREMPLVHQGAFAWTPNAMYTLGFLGLWSIALVARAHAGLVAALFPARLHLGPLPLHWSAGHGGAVRVRPGTSDPRPRPSVRRDRPGVMRQTEVLPCSQPRALHCAFTWLPVVRRKGPYLLSTRFGAGSE